MRLAGGAFVVCLAAGDEGELIAGVDLSPSRMRELTAAEIEGLQFLEDL